MKKSIKTSLIIIALALVVCFAGLVWLGSQQDASVTLNVSDTSRGPTFEVHVERPRMDRPFAGILPTKLEAKLFGELRFDHASPGARIGSVGSHRLELSADGWDLLIETDGEGRIASGTRLVSRSRSRRNSIRCAADPQIVPPAISTSPPGQAPACSMAVSSSS